MHSIFYKATNDTGAPLEYSFVVFANVDTTDPNDGVATIGAKNLQWGYRTYGEGYMLETNP